MIDPESKFIVSHVQGKRDEALIRRLLEDGASRLANRHELVLLTGGDASYAALFPEIFGQAYRPARQGGCYWVAYRRCAGCLYRVHLGKADHLTRERLDQVVLILNPVP